MYTGYSCCCPPPACGVYYVAMASCDGLVVTEEIEADTTTPSKDGLVGGTSQVSLSLEYLVEAGAASPSVNLTTLAPDGTSSTWSDGTPATGYTVHQGLLAAKPGTKVTLAVNNAMARLRWCEIVCC